MFHHVKELQFNERVYKPDVRFTKFTITVFKFSGFSLEIVVKNQIINNN